MKSCSFDKKKEKGLNLNKLQVTPSTSNDHMFAVHLEVGAFVDVGKLVKIKITNNSVNIQDFDRSSLAGMWVPQMVHVAYMLPKFDKLRE